MILSWEFAKQVQLEWCGWPDICNREIQCGKRLLRRSDAESQWVKSISHSVSSFLLCNICALSFLALCSFVPPIRCSTTNWHRHYPSSPLWPQWQRSHVSYIFAGGLQRKRKRPIPCKSRRQRLWSLCRALYIPASRDQWERARLLETGTELW